MPGTLPFLHERTAAKGREHARLEAVCLLGGGATIGIGSVLNQAELGRGQSIVVYGCAGMGLARRWTPSWLEPGSS